ncbi:hypothetical protein O9X98_06245 [Agrobacterium salinitolerans]|nr:hypothetical protein [Agrobacterium salinitolerans]
MIKGFIDMLAHLIENYFIGISLAETQRLVASGKEEFEDDQHYCEHLLVVAKSVAGPGRHTLKETTMAEFEEGKPLFNQKVAAMLVREGFIGLYKFIRPWNEHEIKHAMLPEQADDRYLKAAAYVTAYVFSRITQASEGAIKTLDAEGIFFEVESGVRGANWPVDAMYTETTNRIGSYFAEFINGKMGVEDAIRHIASIGGEDVKPLRSILNAIMIGFVNDDASKAVSMAESLVPEDFAASALAAAFSATSRLRRPGMKQLKRARSIFSGVDDEHKQSSEREEHLRLVIEGIERRRKYYDDIRGWIIR